VGEGRGWGRVGRWRSGGERERRVEIREAGCGVGGGRRSIKGGGRREGEGGVGSMGGEEGGGGSES